MAFRSFARHHFSGFSGLVRTPAALQRGFTAPAASLPMSEPAMKAPRTDASAGPMLTVYTLAGNEAWGPKKVAPGTKAAELAQELDRPASSPGLKLVHGDKVLEPGVDVSALGDPVELRVHFDPPKPFDHSFVHKLVEIADKNADDNVCVGDIIPPDAVEVPSAEVLACEVVEGESKSYSSMFLGLRLRLEKDSKVVVSREGTKASLKLESVELAGVKADSVGNEGAVEAEVLEEADGALVVSAKVKLDFEDFPDDLEPSDGPVEALVRAEQAKLVREGVSFESGKCTELATRLDGLVDKLKEAGPADYHPGTENVVRDLVHPSLFPYVRDESVTKDLSDVTAQEPREKDIWGRPYETSKYQWLPAEVSVDEHGKCTYETYINNLDKEKHEPLYRALEELLGRCLTHLEAAWAHGSSVDAPEEDEDMDDSDCSAADPKELEEKSLRGRTIQVITKIVDYELPAGGTHEGVWHVEGMSHENIVATAEYILRKDSALTGGDLMFQRTFTSAEGGALIMGFPQCRPRSLDTVVDRRLVPLGTLPLPAGRLACWPNSHIHRVTELKNTSLEQAVRRIVVFWLVNPDVRIVSTRHVDPQQKTMSMEKAEEHRKALMQERKFEKQQWNLREVTLCEH